MADYHIVRTAVNFGRIECEYKNYRGEISHRRIKPAIIFFADQGTPWHPQPGWILEGLDLDKGEFRQFAMQDMSNVKLS